MQRLTMLVVALAAAAATACVHSRNIAEPVSGAVTRVYPDSARRVIAAAEQSVTDEGIPILYYDAKTHYLETRYVDVGALHTLQETSQITGPERTVKFRFRTEPATGGTALIAEAIYNRLGPQGGRATEEMVPRSNPAFSVLQRMLDHVSDHLPGGR